MTKTWLTPPPGSRLALVTGAVAVVHRAIDEDAPHPAAARPWQEVLFGGEGQNLYLQGGARPVRADGMATAGTIDLTAYRQLPPVDGAATFASEAQGDAAKKCLEADWARAIG